MKTTSPASPAALHAALLPLLDACPVDERNPEACPLHDVRCLPTGEREAFIRELSDDEARFLASYHHLCMKLKWEGQLPDRA